MQNHKTKIVFKHSNEMKKSFNTAFAQIINRTTCLFVPVPSNNLSIFCPESLKFITRHVCPQNFTCGFFSFIQFLQQAHSAVPLYNCVTRTLNVPFVGFLRRVSLVCIDLEGEADRLMTMENYVFSEFLFLGNVTPFVFLVMAFVV